MTDSVVRAGIPSPTLQVFGAGFGRTGTLSLREALIRLGFGPCAHMLDNVEHPERFALWGEALRCKHADEPIDWQPLLSGFRAIVDWPGAYFWRELAAAHPQAKVILTIRDPERWYDSIQATIFSLPEQSGAGRNIARNHVFGGRVTDRAHCQAVLATHNQAVQQTIAPERLLVFDVKDGWGPLCAFLDLPVPEDEPFPHANEPAAFQTIFGRMAQAPLER
jgi:hypothetical protein